MSRLIDADAILKADENSDKALVLGSGKALEIAYALLKKKVADAPTVDAEVVTRCEDCKYRIYKHVNDWIGEIGGCSIFNHPMPNDAFCSIGRPRDGGDG